MLQVEMMNPLLRGSFEDYAALEEGSAREFLDSAMLTPMGNKRVHPYGVPSGFGATDEIQLCRLRRPEKNVFVLSEKGSGRHLLTARKRGDEYRVSSYEEGEHIETFSAVVKRECSRSCVVYQLFLVVAKEIFLEKVPLAKISPSSTNLAGQFVRKLQVDLPTHFPQQSHYVHDYAKQRMEKKEETATIRLRNKLPALKNGSYSLKFARGRAKVSSSKNFLIYLETALQYDPEVAADHAVLQLGKLGPKTFALDFKYPISPLQAFAIALAAFDSKSIHRALLNGAGKSNTRKR